MADLQLITTHCQMKTFVKDEQVLDAYNTEQHIYYIVHGSCRVDDNGVSKTLREGRIFGELHFLLGDVFGANVYCSSDKADIFVIPPDHLKKILQKLPAIGGRFMKCLAILLDHQLRANYNYL